MPFGKNRCKAIRWIFVKLSASTLLLLKKPILPQWRLHLTKVLFQILGNMQKKKKSTIKLSVETLFYELTFHLNEDR